MHKSLEFIILIWEDKFYAYRKDVLPIEGLNYVIHFRTVPPLTEFDFRQLGNSLEVYLTKEQYRDGICRVPVIDLEVEPDVVVF